MSRRAKPYSKQDILRAMRHTKSNRAAARYLGCSYHHYKKWAKFYKNEDTGETLFDEHLNPTGIGIKKGAIKKKENLMDILEGRIDHSSISPKRLKMLILEEGILKNECHFCGFEEKRVVDNKAPLILNFKDQNKRNYKLENLEMICYNCYFLMVGNIFTDKEITSLEDYKDSQVEPDWELDDYTKERLDQLLGANKADELDENDLISRR